MGTKLGENKTKQTNKPKQTKKPTHTQKNTKPKKTKEKNKTRIIKKKKIKKRKGKAFSVHHCQHYHAPKKNLFNQKFPSTLCRNELRSCWRTGEAFWMVPRGRDERNSRNQQHTLCYPAEKHMWLRKKELPQISGNSNKLDKNWN